MNCPNCFKELQDGTMFCDACGTRIEAPTADPAQSPVPAAEMGVEAVTFCTNCGVQTSADVPYCQNCGAAIETPKKKKGGFKINKKLIGIGVAVVAVVLVAAIVLPLVLGALGGSKLEGMAYVKDGQLYYVKNGKAQPAQVTDELMDDKDFEDGQMSSVSSNLYSYITVTPDGKRMFYVDKIKSDSDGYTLYYKNPTKEKDEGTKIDSDISGNYAVNVKGTKMIYLKGDKLYEYNMKEKSKIASDVTDFSANADCSVVIYKNDDGLYRWESGKGEEEVTDEEIYSVHYFSEDFKTLVYSVDGEYDEDYNITYGAIYKWTAGGKEEKIAKDLVSVRTTENGDLYYITDDGDLCKVAADKTEAEEIDSDVSQVVRICDGGEIYYSKSEDGSVKIGQFIEDDMKEQDESMAVMEEPEYPSYYDWDWPEYDSPDYSDYEDYEAYYEAYYAWYDEYEAAYEAAEEAYDAAVDEYYEQMEIWEEYEDELYAKQERDELRAEIENYEMSVTDSTYYFYDGKSSKELMGSVCYLEDYALDSAVVMVGINNFDAVEKIKLSEISELYYVEDEIESAIYDACSFKLIFGSKVVDFDHEEASGFSISDDGKTMYYREDVSEDGGSYTLIKMSIADGKLGKAEQIADDVGEYYLLNGDVHYFTDVETDEDSYYGIGDYYINGKEIANDVRASLRYNEEETVTYFYTDYDYEEYRGTLNKCENGKAVEICDDVDDYYVAGNGDIYMLCDVSEKDYQGDLYVYSGKEAVKLDKDVYGIVYVMTTEEIIEQRSYYGY